MAAFIAAAPVLRAAPVRIANTTRTNVVMVPRRRAVPKPVVPSAPPSRLVTMSAADTTPTDAATPAALPKLPRDYVVWRWRIFFTMLISYAIYYVTRFSFPFSAPIMQTSMDLSLEQVGLISSCFPAVYGVSKLFGGMIADLGSPRRILALGLVLAALCNIFFTFGNSVPYFALFWAFNGIASSMGFPSCAKLLTTWYSQAERGTYWGILNISLNVGGALSPIVVGTAASALGWRFGMYVPAAMALAMAAIAYFAVRDSPTAAGLPPTPALPMDDAPKKDASKDKKGGALSVFKSQLVDGVLTEPAIWLFGATYFFVYVIRQALTSWTVFYLMQARGVGSLAEAAVRVSGLELGGLVGSVSSGWMSDKFIKSDRKGGAVGHRVKVMILYMIIMAVSLTGFFYVPVTKALLPVQWVLFALTGVGLYGPQLLVGLGTVECVPKRYAGTSNGFVGLLAYAGAALAGYPLTLIVKRLGWNSFFAVIMACSAIVCMFLAPLLGKRSFEQDENDRRLQSSSS